MTGYTIAWLSWLAAFGIIEGIAIAHRKWAGTLTENIQRLFRTNTSKGRLTFASVWVAFGVWFLGHILSWWP